MNTFSKKFRDRNVLLTGLPRSGTTMMCHLLNKLPNAVALHEPMYPQNLGGLSPEEIIQSINEFCDEQRKTVIEQGIATSKSSGGKVPTNPLSDSSVDGVRKKVLDGREIKVSNVTSADFFLYLKHPSFFTACLPFLSEEMECYASVRNPLSVLLSWRNANMAVTKGHVPAAELFAPQLREELASQPDILQRQFIILNFFFQRFTDYLDGRVVRYEDTVSTNGRALARINSGASQLSESLQSRNARAVHSDSDVKVIADKLLAQDNACWNFYTREDVEALLG